MLTPSAHEIDVVTVAESKINSVDFENLAITSLFDDNLDVCGEGGNERCGTAHTKRLSLLNTTYRYKINFSPLFRVGPSELRQVK